MKRRSFIAASVFAATGLTGKLWQMDGGAGGGRNHVVDADDAGDSVDSANSRILAAIMNSAQMGSWSQLAIGERIINVARHFLGVPYVGGTLEGEPESCRIHLGALDCVTLFENALGIARMLRVGGRTIEDLREHITYTRYRGGVLNGYLSRLHYTSEWIADNISKGVVADVTPELGGIPLAVNVHFMSQNPKFYKPLSEDPSLIAEVQAIEHRINGIPRTYIPKDKIQDMEGGLKNGDIIAIATNKVGLDYSHTGIANLGDGRARFMHASTQKKKVIVDGTVSDYVNSVQSHIGITVVRPLEVKATH